MDVVLVVAGREVPQPSICMMLFCDGGLMAERGVAIYRVFVKATQSHFCIVNQPRIANMEASTRHIRFVPRSYVSVKRSRLW